MEHVLIIRLSALGDVAMTLPVIYSLAAAYPDTKFTLLTQNVASHLIIDPPVNLSVYVADVKGVHKGVRGIYKLYKELSKEHVTAVADLHGVIRSFILDFLFRIGGVPVERIDKGRFEKRQLTRRRHKKIVLLKTSFDRYISVFNRLGYSFSPNFDSLFSPGSTDVVHFSEWSGVKQEGEVWIGVAPFAKHIGKIYPLEKMEKVVADLADRSDYKLFLFGGGAVEKELFDRWCLRYPGVVSTVGQHGFRKELSLISQLDVMVTMDSANMHLASLVGVSVVSVWGATHYYAGFLGWKQSPENIVSIDLECRPCSVFGDKPCFRGDYACLNRIEPEQIIRKVEEVIEVTQRAE